MPAINAASFRLATPADAEAIAAPHADSWSRHYQGAYSDAYLDRDVYEDRRSVWADRFRTPPEDHYTVLGERDGEVIGFAHTCLEADPEWGALLDNLHVRYDLKRQGTGRVLMAETAAVLLQRRPGSCLFLWVLEQNTAAQSFYVAMGGTIVGEGAPTRSLVGAGRRC